MLFMKICIEREFSKTLVPWVGKTGKMIAVFIGQRLRENHIDLTTKQWILLEILNGEDGRPQSDLALITERNKASLVRLINTMERKKLVKRKQDVLDRRVNNIFLTDHGRSVYETTLPTVRKAFEHLQQDIQIENIESVISTMKKVLDNIKHYEVTTESN